MTSVSASPLERIPFTPIDEAVYGLDTDVEPWTIQLELRVAGHLEEARLERALRLALDRHAMARARMAPAPARQRTHMWQITPQPDLDPLLTMQSVGGSSLAAHRAERYSLPVPLAESPPLRIRLVHHPDGDVLMTSVNHTAFDGFGALRLLHSVARAYTGAQDPPPSIELPQARDLSSLVGDAPGRPQRLRRVGEKLRDLASPPARLAADGGTPDRAGYGVHHLSLTPEQTQSLLERDGPGTVNDVLVAALNLSVEDWNAQRGAPCRRVSVLVPINLRPSAWRQDVVTNMVVDARVSTDPADRQNPRATLEAVMAESARIKQGGGAALLEALKGLPAVPPAVKDRLSGLLALTGDRLVDTAVLSNLGDISDLPTFGTEAGETTEMWFSAPTRMPCGLSLGATSAANRLHLAFRYRHPLWSAEAAAAFSRLYVEQVERVVAET